MKIKSKDMLTITDCCEILHISKDTLKFENWDDLSIPDGDVSQRLRELLKEDRKAFISCKSDSISDYENYISTWPDGLYTDVASLIIEENSFYQKNCKSIGGLKAYLGKYPTGVYVQEAERALQEFQVGYRKQMYLIWAIFIIIIVILCLSSYRPVSYLDIENMNSIGKMGGKFSLNINTDVSASNISVDIDANWLEVESKSDNAINLIADTNLYNQQETKVIVKAYSSFLGIKYDCISKEKVLVQESGLATYFRIKDNSLEIPEKGIDEDDPYLLQVETDGTSWSVHKCPHWLKAEANTEKNQLEISATANEGEINEGEIILKSNNGNLSKIAVKQNGDPRTFEASPEQLSFGVSEDYAYVTIHRDGTKNFVADSDKSWISVSDVGNDRLKISCSTSYGQPRSGKVEVKCGKKELSIVVEQEGYRNCSRCNGKGEISCTNSKAQYNWNVILGRYVHQERGVMFYTFGMPNYGWINCTTCGGSGDITCPGCDGKKKFISPY